MNDKCVYLIQLWGRVDEDEINAMSPIQMTALQTDTAATTLAIHTDQSGLIGLMRHLHSLSFVFLSVTQSANQKVGRKEE